MLVEQTPRVVAGTEEEAILAFLTFLQALPANIILVCMDEATMAVMMDKMEALDRGGVLGKVVGCTWWSRVLMCPTNAGARTTTTMSFSLEDCWATTFPMRPLPNLRTANVVAGAMVEAVAEVARRAGTTPSSGRFVTETAVETSEWRKMRGREVLEIVISFKPDTITSFSVDRMDQINIDSDDEEVKEMVKVKTKVKVYPLKILESRKRVEPC